MSLARLPIHSDNSFDRLIGLLGAKQNLETEEMRSDIRLRPVFNDRRVVRRREPDVGPSITQMARVRSGSQTE